MAPRRRRRRPRAESALLAPRRTPGDYSSQMRCGVDAGTSQTRRFFFFQHHTELCSGWGLVLSSEAIGRRVWEEGPGAPIGGFPCPDPLKITEKLYNQSPRRGGHARDKKNPRNNRGRRRRGHWEMRPPKKQKCHTTAPHPKTSSKHI